MTVAVCFALGGMVTKVSGKDAISREGGSGRRDTVTAWGYKEGHVEVP